MMINNVNNGSQEVRISIIDINKGKTADRSVINWILVVDMR